MKREFRTGFALLCGFWLVTAAGPIPPALAGDDTQVLTLSEALDMALSRSLG